MNKITTLLGLVLLVCLGCKEEKKYTGMTFGNFVIGEFQLGDTFKKTIPSLTERKMVDPFVWLDEVGDVYCEERSYLGLYKCRLDIGKYGEVQLQIWGEGDSLAAAAKDCALKTKDTLDSMGEVITYSNQCVQMPNPKPEDIKILIDVQDHRVDK
jgi:hypothetical protein